MKLCRLRSLRKYVILYKGVEISFIEAKCQVKMPQFILSFDQHHRLTTRMFFPLNTHHSIAEDVAQTIYTQTVVISSHNIPKGIFNK